MPYSTIRCFAGWWCKSSISNANVTLLRVTKFVRGKVHCACMALLLLTVVVYISQGVRLSPGSNPRYQNAILQGT